ncbi:MAG: ribose-phosphate pyrophosphokinase, partial [Deltaproteobacteria bacterium]
MPRDRGRIALIACESGKALMKRLHEAFGELCRQRTSLFISNDYHLIPTRETHFANQEVKTEILENIRGDDVYILQCMDDPCSERSVNDNFMALITAIDAAFQSDAESITAVIPQFPYARQERRKGREGITARLVARFLETAGASRVITLDVHAQAIAGFFFHAKFENLHASRVIIEDFTRNFPTDNLIVVAPDVGSAERARFYSKNIAAHPVDLAILDKVRDYGRKSTVASMRLVGDVKGKNVFMGDDMIATGGTLIAACRELKERG